MLSFVNDKILLDDPKTKYLVSSRLKRLNFGDKLKLVRTLNTILAIIRHVEIPLEMFLLKKNDQSAMNFIISNEVVKFLLRLGILLKTRNLIPSSMPGNHSKAENIQNFDDLWIGKHSGFIYDTLNSIKSTSEAKEDEKIVKDFLESRLNPIEDKSNIEIRDLILEFLYISRPVFYGLLHLISSDSP